MIGVLAASVNVFRYRRQNGFIIQYDGGRLH